MTELTRPLGRDNTSQPGRPWGRWLVQGMAASVGLACLGLAAFVAFVRNPDGGEPIAIAAIETRAAPQQTALPTTAGPATQETRSQSTARQVETESGVTIVRPGAEVPGSIIITVPDDPGTVKLASAPDSRLTERSRHGLLPKTGPDGATPTKIYARPLGPDPTAKPAGRIALLVGGLGISQSGTAEAVAKLPGAVSLAFAP